MKYFYQMLLELSIEQEEFIPTVKRVKDHIFQRNLMYSSDLRKFLFELASNHEFLFISQNKAEDETSNIRKVLKNNDGFVKRISVQLNDYPSALNILHPHEQLLDSYLGAEDLDEKALILQKITLELIKHVSL